MLDSDDLESQLGPGGTSQNHFFAFFGPGRPWESQVVPTLLPGFPALLLGFPTLQMGCPTLPQIDLKLKPKVIFQVSFSDDFG